MSTSIGSVLKEARNKKTLSLEEVHSKIKIHPRVLLLLEEEKFDKLPSPLFAKSFLKSYADFLEVNSEEVMQAYEKTGVKDPEQTIYIKPAGERGESLDFQKIFVIAPFLIIGIFLIAAGFYYMPQILSEFSSKNKMTVTPSKPVKTASKSSKKTEAPKAEIKKETPVKVSAKKGEGWLRSPEAGNFPTVSAGSAIEFELKAVDAVWVEVTVDGKILFQGILKKGSVENWSANDSVELWTGNAANMLLSVNKASIGSPGKGTVRRMQISREGVRILPKEAR